jgi:hypothetical protein
VVATPWRHTAPQLNLHRLDGFDVTPAPEGRVPDSWFEELLAACLSDADLPTIVPQYRILDQNGTFVARVDLGIPAIRLGLEAHSRRFHFGPDAEPLDEQRDMAAAACGWELLCLGWYASRRPAPRGVNPDRSATRARCGQS